MSSRLASLSVRLVAFAALLVGGSAVAAPLLPAPSPRNAAAFGEWLDRLDRDDPRSVHMAVDGARSLLAGTAASVALRRQTWQRVSELQANVISRWSARVRANASWAAALDCRFASHCPTQTEGLPVLDGMLRALQSYGGHVIVADGHARLDADRRWLARKLDTVAPQDEVAWAELQAEEQSKALLVGGVLVAPLESVRKRMARWQALLQAHPDSPHAKVAKERIASLLDVYLSPLKWTPGAADATRLNADRRATYKRLLATKPPSPHAKVVNLALRGLIAEQGVSPALAKARNAVDEATEQALKLQARLTAAAGDRSALRRLVREFGRWAKASDRRLAKLADGLSRDDARKLSAYAGQRLFPEIEAIMALITRPKRQRKAQSRGRNLPGGPGGGAAVP